MYKYLEQFKSEMLKAGFNPPENIIANGDFQRFSTNGKPTDKAGWYVIYLDNIPGGSFGDWRTGFSQDWRADIGRELSREEHELVKNRMNEIQLARKQEKKKLALEAQQKAKSIWNNGRLDVSEHAYLIKKRVGSHGIKRHQNILIIPLRNKDGTICSLQFITENGEKRFLSGGITAGCYFTIGTFNTEEAICITEGFATGASIHEATGLSVAVAFSTSNLLAIAQIIQEKFPQSIIVICADNDRGQEANPGVSKAQKVAKIVNGALAIPVFDSSENLNKTDFNDVANLYGAKAVRTAIFSAIASFKENVVDDSIKSNEWHCPKPFNNNPPSEPYPIHALPDCIRNAVEEVQGFTKAPFALVASCALASLSLAGQAHVNIKRDDKLIGPVSLFFLTIADSGERKSTCDGFFMQAIRDYEFEQAELAKPKVHRYKMEYSIWKTKVEGLNAKIRKLIGNVKNENELHNLENLLFELEHQQPSSPQIPRYIYSDVTPESLKKNLATIWPSAGIISSEGGIVFGGHSMGKDSVMRNFATYNCGWDGKGIPTDRISSDSFNIEEVRLTMSIQVQKETLKEFTSRYGELTRGIGFFARVLIAWPDSTQGTRFYTGSPEKWPSLEAFNRIISNILNFPSPVTQEGKLNPRIMCLDKEAKLSWIKFHDAIESKLAEGGAFYDVRDVASKAADNAVRLACLFHLVDIGLDGEVSKISLDKASEIVLWHLKEAQRVFGKLAMSPELLNAKSLENYCINYCSTQKTNSIPKSLLLQLGPNVLRKKETLDAAIVILEELNRVKIKKEGKTAYIEINPNLFSLK
jgi:putative DNA primase/helicase